MGRATSKKPASPKVVPKSASVGKAKKKKEPAVQEITLPKEPGPEKIDAQLVEEWIKVVLRWPSKRTWPSASKERRIRACFGCSAAIIADTWNRIIEKHHPNGFDKPGASVKHLLWAFVFLKCYSTEDIHCAIVGWPCEVTYRTWTWYFVKQVQGLKSDVISLDNRFKGLPLEVETNCFISVDGTDCSIYEPWPFNTKMYSHKTNGPGFTYEVGVCILTRHIVWVAGPFKAGDHDGVIFKKSGLEKALFPEEMVECDRGYKGSGKFAHPGMGSTHVDRKMKSNVRAQHECVNSRIKIFNVLTTYFRHCHGTLKEVMEKHKACFEAVAVITQLKLLAGEKIFNEPLQYTCSYF